MRTYLYPSTGQLMNSEEVRRRRVGANQIPRLLQWSHCAVRQTAVAVSVPRHHWHSEYDSAVRQVVSLVIVTLAHMV